MSDDRPPPGQEPPDDDPFRKKPRESPSSGGPESGGPESPYGSPYGGAAGVPPPPPPEGSDPFGGPPGGGRYGGGGGGPYGGGGGPYGGDPLGGTDPYAGMPPLAPFGRRLTARIVDVLIIAIPVAVLSLAVGGFDTSTSNGHNEWNDFTDQVNTGRQWLWSLISLIAYVAYDTLMTRSRGQTVGKRWLKLRVAMLNNGAVPDTNASLLRALVLWLPALLCCFCLWWAIIILTIWTGRPYKQGLHDRVARTVVVSAAQ
ncbi:RDD family protein [Streptomyces liangshanensis]|uniref:RDD family protein n=1 Tax=Streptomyces liangshanensis TaxID=2717324 RepID=A0A6G9H250_9ACTN|nr:RDD family protein [Streptomyces liangshanensis]QIQ04613.1 RDD family protein [Streptomyces liangshanensis]